MQNEMENEPENKPVEGRQEKRGWGGSRKGAGRPAQKKNVRSIALRIPADVAEILDRQDHKSAFIVEAIRAYARQQGK